LLFNKKIFSLGSIRQCESGCPQRRYFEAEKKLLLDLEFFIGG
jgi:hypothetical protein